MASKKFTPDYPKKGRAKRIKKITRLVNILIEKQPYMIRAGDTVSLFDGEKTYYGKIVETTVKKGQLKNVQ